MLGKERLRQNLDGLLISLQFFSAIPIHVALPMDSKRIKRSILFLPFVGLLFGLLITCIFHSLQLLPFTLSPLAQTLIVITGFAILSGGLHLDGWMDMSDAFFSYRSHERRLEIMEDSRVGAFAVLSLLFLLGWRFLFIYEIVEKGSWSLWFVLCCIPFLARLIMGHLLIFGKMVKQTGLGYTFQQGLRKKDSWFYFILVIVIGVCLQVIAPHVLPIFLALCGGSALLGLGFHYFFKRHFGGLTGDLLGATVEGVENGLWFIAWLFIVYVMG